jgi:nonribosomal peptide synthetase DhbF
MAPPARGPGSPAEEILCSLFAGILGLPSVGIDDSFFDLGGHSILATQLLTRVRAAFQVDVQLRDFFRGPSVEQLAARIEQMITAQVSQMSEDNLRSALAQGETR